MIFETVVIVLLVLILVIEYLRYSAAKKLSNSTAHPNASSASVPQSVSSSHGSGDCHFLKTCIDEEISKLRRYNTYSLTLMDFTLNLDADMVAKDLEEFVRKSDRVFVCRNKIYIFFPFTKDSSEVRKKIEKRIFTHLQAEHGDDVRLITVKFRGFVYDPELKPEEFPAIKM